MFLFCFLNLQKCQKTELLSACDLCRDMICMLKKHHSTRVKAFILIQRNQKYHSAISHGKPLSSEGRNTRKLAPMRQADGLYIALQQLKSFHWSIKRQPWADVALNLAHDHQLEEKYLFIYVEKRESTLKEWIQITQLSTHSWHQFTLPSALQERIHIFII